MGQEQSLGLALTNPWMDTQHENSRHQPLKPPDKMSRLKDECPSGFPDSRNHLGQFSKFTTKPSITCRVCPSPMLDQSTKVASAPPSTPWLKEDAPNASAWAAEGLSLSIGEGSTKSSSWEAILAAPEDPLRYIYTTAFKADIRQF